MKTEYTVSPSDATVRLDRFLRQQAPQHSRAYLQQLIDRELVTVNGASKKARYPVKAGERIQVDFPDIQPFPTAAAMPLDIIYEDNDLLAINKPVGMTVHPNSTEDQGTLVQALLAHAPEIVNAVYDPESAISRMRPGIVHRLDKDTGGVILAAKTREALLNLAKQFHDHTVQKCYLALVHGEITEDQTIHTVIARKHTGDGRMGARPLSNPGREAITHIHPVRTIRYGRDVATVIECRIETGRTHQIRVHCKYIGHPVIGDPLYTNKPASALSKRLNVTHQLLHASRITFRHPKSGREISLESRGFEHGIPFDNHPAT
ncbi:RluA family pseudouridine synthase [Patescibacteria group bacterium]|nr:RluA family pseudouridine synthase [Patescibacteria group bacterium]